MTTELDDVGPHGGDGSNDGSRARARHSVRHFLADFDKLESRFPGAYPRMIVRAEGAFVWDDNGLKLLDAGGHLGACQVGHGRREIAERIAAQAAELDFVALDSGVSHPRALELAEALSGIVPVDDPIFSFTSSGSESNELAYKIARAFHHRRGDTSRTFILSRDGSYHGSTFAGMAATGAPVFRDGYGPVSPGFRQVAQPSPGRCGFCEPGGGCTLRCADALEEAVRELGPENIAAVVAEPVAILQAVKMPHAGYWPRVQSICADNGILLILDEVVTGFGRTGRMFGAEHWGVRPDIMTMAKGITSGYVPLGAVAASRRVEKAFSEPLLHLNTYAGHPLACAAALATLEILDREQLVDHAAAMEPLLRASLEAVAARLPRARCTTVVGLLSSIEVNADGLEDVGDLVLRIRHEMYENGVLARCSQAGDVVTVVFYPALIVGPHEIEAGVAAVGNALDTCLG